jgi:TatD DNase family protein
MQPKIFDIHSHLNFRDFDNDREEVIKEMQKNGIWTICVGADEKTSRECVKLAEKYENIYASVGVHPTEHLGVELPSDLRKLAEHPKVVAIGECGLDFKDRPSQVCEGPTFAEQQDLFKKQIELALELDKPLMIHCRDAHKEVIDIVSSFKNQDLRLRGNIHFFSGTWEQAKKYFELGLTISFAGPVTFANQYDETIKNAPIDKIMIETDAPFAAPVPHRGKRNEPMYVLEIAKKIAELKNMTLEEVLTATTNNALRLFLGRDF